MKPRRRSFMKSLFSLLFTSTALAQSPPLSRFEQSTVYINNTAYILGGILSDNSLATDFWSIDLSQEFNSSSPPWQSLPPLSAATANAAAAGGLDGRIYLLGGQTWDCSFPFVSVYNPVSQAWQSPQLGGTTPTRRQSGSAFLSRDGNTVFYFGGSSTSCSTGATTLYNTLNAFSLRNSSWFNPGNSNPPAAEAEFALTRISAGGEEDKIVIIGGQTANAFVQMGQVGVFDVGSQSWTFVTATTAAGQDVPEDRVGHTAVTTSDGKVVVFGGTVGPSDRAAQPQLTVLDTSSIPFQWSSPNISGNPSLSPSSGLVGHSAIMTEGDVMILAFGKDGNGNFNQQMYILDTQKMEWQEMFTPSTTPPPSTPTHLQGSPSNNHDEPSIPSATNPSVASQSQTSVLDSSSSNKLTVAVSASVSLSVLALVSAAVFIVFLRRRAKRNAQRESASHQHLLSQPHELTYISPTAKYLAPRTPRRGFPSKRVFNRIFSRGKAHASPPPTPPRPLGVFLPAWAAQHVREGGSSNSSNGDDDDDVMEEDRMVQLASMSFMAPKMQLRVVNPDEESLQSLDVESVRRRVSAGKQV